MMTGAVGQLKSRGLRFYLSAGRISGQINCGQCPAGSVGESRLIHKGAGSRCMG